MGKLEALQKRIDQIADKVRHLRYIVIVLISSIIGTIFGISQHKIQDDFIINTLLIIGTIVFVLTGVLINIEEEKRDDLINTLEETDKDL